MRPCLHGYPRRRQISKPLLDSFGTGSEATAIDHFSFFVERAVMAPNISKVDSDRDLDPSRPAWNFRDEVLRWLLHGEQSLRFEGPAHPIYQHYSHQNHSKNAD